MPVEWHPGKEQESFPAGVQFNKVLASVLPQSSWRQQNTLCNPISLGDNRTSVQLQ